MENKKNENLKTIKKVFEIEFKKYTYILKKCRIEQFENAENLKNQKMKQI